MANNLIIISIRYLLFTWPECIISWWKQKRKTGESFIIIRFDGTNQKIGLISLEKDTNWHARCDRMNNNNKRHKLNIKNKNKTWKRSDSFMQGK